MTTITIKCDDVLNLATLGETQERGDWAGLAFACRSWLDEEFLDDVRAYRYRGRTIRLGAGEGVVPPLKSGDPTSVIKDRQIEASARHAHRRLVKRLRRVGVIGDHYA